MRTTSKVGVVGYGYVGKAIDRLFGGNNPHVDKGRFGRSRVNKCELAIVCVPTPQLEDGSCDISAVEDALSWLETPLILIKSTIPPGTTQFLREKYGKNINFSPEYLGESSYFTPFWKYPDPKEAKAHQFVIVGGAEASQILEYFQKVMSVDTHYVIATSQEAELTKYMENTFFATKVAFCNEFFEIAKLYGVDYKRLRELWLLDSRINPNHTLVFEDKRGFGGKCLPKDLHAIINDTTKRGFDPLLLRSVAEVNETWK